MYGVFVSEVKLVSFPTSSLRNPVENKYIYQDEGTVHDFPTKEEAFAFAEDAVGPNLVVFCGETRALNLYHNTWAGGGEVCLQEPERLREAIYHCTAKSYRWDYMADEVKDLDHALLMTHIDGMSEEDALMAFDDDDREDYMDGKKPVTAYSMTTGDIVTKVTFMTMMTGKEIPFKDMTEEEQAHCIYEINERSITVSSGKMYEVALLRKYNGNIFLVKLEGYSTYYWSKVKTAYYDVRISIDDAVRDIKKKINKYRIKKGWV